MERYKNINSNNEVNKVLEKLQELYKKKDMSKVEMRN